MKIVYVDSDLSGHHIEYLKKLMETKADCVAVVPQIADGILPERQRIVAYDSHNLKFSVYRRWLKKVYRVIQEEKPDLVHFLYGDIFYRFFGLGLKKSYPTLVTFHVVRRSFLHDISLRRIFFHISCGVVHTQNLFSALKGIKIANVRHIEYPHFSVCMVGGEADAKKQFGLPSDQKILGAIGGTRDDKGLDLLLEALKGVKQPFHLLIAGARNAFSQEYIEEHSAPYRDRVTIFLKYLSDEEYARAIDACDIIVLPYRKIFNGASGPLSDAAVRGKAIIAPSHGSLGDIVSGNHLGYLFESENIPSLSAAIDKALGEDFVYDEKAAAYQRQLDPERFKEEYRKVYLELISEVAAR